MTYAKAYEVGQHNRYTGYNLGDKFYHPKDTQKIFRVVGYNSRARKYPYIFEDVKTGKKRKASMAYFTTTVKV